MTFMAFNVEILILFKNNENNLKEKKLANNMSSIVKIDHQIYYKFETSILRYFTLIGQKLFELRQ